MIDKEQTAQDIITNCSDVVTKEEEMQELLSKCNGAFLSPKEFIEKAKSLEIEQVQTLIFYGPFSQGIEFNEKPIQNFCKDLKCTNLNCFTWDFLIQGSNEEVRRTRDLLHHYRYMMTEIPWESNSDTRLSYYLALDSIYTMHHLYNYSENFKDIALVLCLAEKPFSGFKKSKDNKSELPVSAIEVRVVLELLKRGYPMPPVFMIYGLFDYLSDYSLMKKSSNKKLFD